MLMAEKFLQLTTKEEKIYLHNICFQIFIHTSVNTIFKNHYKLVVKYIYE